MMQLKSSFVGKRVAKESQKERNSKVKMKKAHMWKEWKRERMNKVEVWTKKHKVSEDFVTACSCCSKKYIKTMLLLNYNGRNVLMFKLRH
ncbi:hypothetical protein PTKIN_Ptkin19aG0072300 [Pterospermum kingtungense]